MKTREFTGVPLILPAPGEIIRQELGARALSQPDAHGQVVDIRECEDSATSKGWQRECTLEVQVSERFTLRGAKLAERADLRRAVALGSYRSGIYPEVRLPSRVFLEERIVELEVPFIKVGSHVPIRERPGSRWAEAVAWIPILEPYWSAVLEYRSRGWSAVDWAALVEQDPNYDALLNSEGLAFVKVLDGEDEQRSGNDCRVGATFRVLRAIRGPWTERETHFLTRAESTPFQQSYVIVCYRRDHGRDVLVQWWPPSKGNWLAAMIASQKPFAAIAPEYERIKRHLH